MEKENKTTLKKNQTADIPTKSGSKYSYQYVDIAQIHEYLEANNMSYYQYVDRIDNDDYIMTVKIINGEEKPPIRGSRIVDATLYGNDNPAQKQGSALTYARRYSLLMAFGLATEDDDNRLTKNKELTKEDAENYVFTFGKHKGLKLTEVIEKYDDYIQWLLENSEDKKLLKCIELLTSKTKMSDEEQELKLIYMNKVNTLILETSTDYEEFLKYFEVDSNTEMTISQLKEGVDLLEKKKKKNKEEVF